MRFLTVVSVAAATLFFYPLVKSSPAHAQDQAPGQLSADDLSTMTQALGYTTTKNDKSVTINYDEDNWKMSIDVDLSTDKTKVWLITYLVKTPFKYDSDDYQKLLKANNDIGPCAFCLSDTWLTMDLALDNRNVTPAIMRREINYIVKQVKTTESTWTKK